MSLSKLKQNAFTNKEVKAEYDKLESEFALANLLLEMRNKAGLTQNDLAKLMNTSFTSISRLESGKGNPSLKTINNFAQACGFQLNFNYERLN
ncbi:helix-turn-helix domain-containing protein [Thalassotalea sp. ND16A]|uniref:helix-turn-helix domain-containing protein n=1 Tax=Thalassotalea sp. ND16A TaxID=1535422 RepID=UPI00051A49F2|nr:helix-turn-helix transcriptional regulator [Thalassotalea sp. ND16A]KGJ90480.1 putative transcriptional regulator, XRE family [Thalassotalea sp. ND16A]